MAIAKALVRYVGERSLLGKSDSNHWIAMDSPPEHGQPSAANNPSQLLLIACAGCVTIDTISILTKGRQDVRRLEIEILALRRDVPPKIVRQLEYHVQIDGPLLTEDKVRRAVELSLTKYCSVSLSLDRSTRFFAQITLNGDAGERWEIPRDPMLFEAVPGQD